MRAGEKEDARELSAARPKSKEGAVAQTITVSHGPVIPNAHQTAATKAVAAQAPPAGLITCCMASAGTWAPP